MYGNDHVGLVFFVRRLQIGDHFVFMLAPGNAGLIFRGLVRTQKHFAVAEHCDSHAVTVDDPRRVGLGQIPAAAEVRHLLLLQKFALSRKRRLAIIARVVVRHAQAREVSLQQWQARRRVGQVVVRFLDLFAFLGNDAFQIRDRHVRSMQYVGKR